MGQIGRMGRMRQMVSVIRKGYCTGYDLLAARLRQLWLIRLDVR